MHRETVSELLRIFRQSSRIADAVSEINAADRLHWLGSAEERPETRTDSAVLDACAALIGEFGERNLTIDQVAERAGRSRMTVFRRFNSREELITATYRRELTKVIVRVTQSATATSNAVERADLLINEFLDSALGHPVSLALLRGEQDALVQVTKGGPEFSAQRWLRDLCAWMLSDDALEDPLSPSEADFVGSLLMRIIFSLLLLPEQDRNEQSRREYIRMVAERVVGDRG